MSKSVRGVLRNVQGEHLQALSESEIEFYEALAHDGSVIKSQSFKKGRVCLIFRLKQKPMPDATPSQSNESACCLDDGDSRAVAGEMGEHTRAQLERWEGWKQLRGSMLAELIRTA